MRDLLREEYRRRGIDPPPFLGGQGRSSQEIESLGAAILVVLGYLLAGAAVCAALVAVGGWVS